MTIDRNKKRQSAPASTLLSKKHESDIAIAISYDEEVGVPEVSALGRRKMAKHVRKIAARYGVPVHKDRALAENLSAIEVDEEIPAEFYGDVATLFRKLKTVGE